MLYGVYLYCSSQPPAEPISTKEAQRRHFRSFYWYWHYVMTMVIFGDIFILILIFLGSARLYIHWPQTEDNRGGAWKTSDHWRFSSLLLVNNICSQHIMIFNQFLSSFKHHFQFSCLARKRGIILTRISARAVVYSNTHTYFQSCTPSLKWTIFSTSPPRTRSAGNVHVWLIGLVTFSILRQGKFV